jgi:ABC-type transport system involved in multi-copper enzyme maturation permease subunit
MLLFVQPYLAWLRRRLSWSVDHQTQQEVLATGFLVAGAAILIWLGTNLAALPRALLWGLLIIAAAVLWRRGWLKLFGPVLFYDMVRNGRRAGHIVLRSLYAFVLVYVLIVVYLLTLEERGGGLVWITTGPALADFTAKFFYIFMAIQLLAAFVLTPAYTAGAIAAEKERQSFDALMATDLRNHEIVLSMFVSRLANLCMVLLTGLPILGLLEFLGGLDPHLVLAGYAITGLTILGIGAVGLLHSVRSRKPRAAILATYIWGLAYLILASLSGLLLLPQFEVASFPSTDSWTSPITVEDAVNTVNAGNLFWAVGVLLKGLAKGGALDQLIGPLLIQYAWFHGVVALTCVGLAVVRLRRSALEEDSDSARKAARNDALRRLRLIPLRGWVATCPLLWKEIIVDVGPRPGWKKRLSFGMVVALVLWPAVHLANWYGGLPSQEAWWKGMRETLNLWICSSGVLIGVPLLALVGIRAAGSVSGERARQTLDGLLTTPVEANAIVFAKWLGSLFIGRSSWALLGVVWGLGLIAGAVTLKGIGGFLLAWFVYAGFMAALGLYFSVVCRSTQRAAMLTLVAAILLLALSCLFAFDLSWHGMDSFSLVPGATLWLLPWMTRTSPEGDQRQLTYEIQELNLVPWHGPFFITLGILLCLLLTLGLWLLASYRFRIAIGRNDRRRKGVGAGEAFQDGPANRTTVRSDHVRIVFVISPVGQASEDSNDTGTLKTCPTAPAVKSMISKTSGEALPRLPAPRWRWLKRLRPALLILLPLGLLQGWYFLESVSAERRLQKALAEADRLDPGWTLEDLEAKRVVLPDDQNSAVHVKTVHQMIPPGWPSVEFSQGFEITGLVEPEPNLLLSQARAQLLEAELRKVGKALSAARQLIHMPQGRASVQWSKDGIGSSPEPTNQARSIASLLGYDAWLRCDKGDVDGALESCRAILNAEHSIGDEPTLISMLTRVGIRAVAIQHIERALAQGQPSETALAQLQIMLQELEKDRLQLIAARGERALNDRMMHALQVGDVSSNNVNWMLGLGGARKGGLPSVDELVIFLSNSLPGQRAGLLHYSNQLVEIAKLPDHLQDAEFIKAAGTLLNKPLFVRLFFTGVNRFAVTYRRALAYLRCAQVAVATERFRMRQNRWPKSLAELVEESLLTEVPRDPCDGQELRYRRLGDGVVIYSVGADLKDNGGHLERRNPNIMGSDWGIRLWDVSRRRQTSGPVDALPKFRFP